MWSRAEGYLNNHPIVTIDVSLLQFHHIAGTFLVGARGWGDWTFAWS
jgi:hypothetical protein